MEREKKIFFTLQKREVLFDRFISKKERASTKIYLGLDKSF